MAAVVFDEASRTYAGGTAAAVDRLSLSISDGEFLVLVGPSGCGKTTSLRMLAGLEEVDSGTIRIGDRDVTHVAPKNRDVAMVFQNYALYPHMTVAENIGFALKVGNRRKAEISQKVREAARLLDLEHVLGRKPQALSGGQRQRVAMGRAIVREPQVFLMDEPLSNLDAKLRVETRTQIAALQRRLATTTVYVTHDQVEAMTMGDRVAVMKDGLLQQLGTPRELYDAPANAFVAGFIGSPSMSIFELALTPEGVQLGNYLVRLPRDVLGQAASEGLRSVYVGFRPEDLVVTTEDAGIDFSVSLFEELGADGYAYGQLDQVDSEKKNIVVRTDGREVLRIGDRLHVAPKQDRAYVFSSATGLHLR
jgi:multiple sugar transport system ATP-binding protein